MERAEILLEKLKTQLREHAGKEALSLTFRQLYDEIFQAGASAPAAGSKRVSVVLPVHAQAPAADQAPPSEEKIVETLLVDEAEIEAELQALKESAELINELSTKARVAPLPADDGADEIPTLASHLPYLPPQFNPPPAPRQVTQEPAGGSTINDRYDGAVSPQVNDGQGTTPTLNDRLAHAAAGSEQGTSEPTLNDRLGKTASGSEKGTSEPALNNRVTETGASGAEPIQRVEPSVNDRPADAGAVSVEPGQRGEPSLNDRLRAAQKELADQLQEAPVRDLRKAIGINDRYLFINELFQGNEAMFERSLKTLNGFSILPEAEFWMQRELQVKLGWKDNDPLVLQFIQLIRRRFS